MARVLHLIDSLAPGGAERVAINLVNALNGAGHTAWLCATRAEGLLKTSISEPKRYFFLQKKRKFDINAFWRFVKCLRRERIEIIHAHSSSVYWAVAARGFTGCKIVWHDHFGNRASTPFVQKWMLRGVSVFMNVACCVSKPSADWATQNLFLNPKKIVQTRHFATLKPVVSERIPNGMLHLICVANLRPEKDHTNLLNALALLKKDYAPTQVRLYLVGEDSANLYQHSLHNLLVANNLEAYVQYVGAQSDLLPWLQMADVGVLASRWEGLPVALLEYGLAGKAVVCTEVGACAEVLENGQHGLLVPPENSPALAEALRRLLEDPALRQRLGQSLQQHVQQNYSAQAAIGPLEKIYADLA